MTTEFPCAACAKPIKFSASKCPHCDHKVSQADIDARRGGSESDGEALLGCIGVPALIAFAAYMIFAAGPSERGAAARQSVETERLIFVGQDQIKARLRDPSSAEFSGVYVSRKAGAPAICGTVNSRNGFAGMSGPTRFIAGGATAIDGDGTMDAANFQQAWDSIC
ncbi:MAG: hypothetical protein H6920_05040 [Sphingomonadaceae bacterium]|nr:hypothetical protein [Sphingomonadaceae bacterium]